MKAVEESNKGEVERFNNVGDGYESLSEFCNVHSRMRVLKQDRNGYIYKKTEHFLSAEKPACGQRTETGAFYFKAQGFEQILASFLVVLLLFFLHLLITDN